MSNKSTRTPIAKDSDESVVKTDTEEIVEVAEDSEPVQNKVSKSEILCNIDEFIITKSLRPEYAEGFKAFMGSIRFQSSEEWEVSYEKFKNRKVQ